MSATGKSELAKDVAGVPASRYRKLPEPIRLDQVTTTQPASDAPAPDLGRDPDHDFMLRFGAG
jgi:hypothetical protein